MTGNPSRGAVADIDRMAGGEAALLVTNRHSYAHKVIATFVAAGLREHQKIYVAMHNDISLDLLSRSLTRQGTCRAPVRRRTPGPRPCARSVYARCATGPRVLAASCGS